MNPLQRKIQSLPLSLAARMLLTGAFFCLWMLAFMWLAGDGVPDGGDLFVAGGSALLVALGPLAQEWTSWRRPLLAAGMAGCVLMLMGYSFAAGYTASQAGGEALSVWNWFTIVFVFLVPVAAFLQAFRAYVRLPENDDS